MRFIRWHRVILNSEILYFSFICNYFHLFIFIKSRLMYTKIRIEEILFGFSYSVNSIVSLILLYKQNQKVPKERQGSTNSSTVSTLHQSGFQSINKSPPQFNMPQSLENWPNFESGKLNWTANPYLFFLSKFLRFPLSWDFTK